MDMLRLNTTQLRVGNIVHCHGSRFELIERNDDTPDSPRPVVWFRTKYLGPVRYRTGETCEVIPMHWREDWIVQGNKLATWGVEKAVRS